MYHAPRFLCEGHYKKASNKILADRITKGLLCYCTAEPNRGKHLLLVSRNNWYFEVGFFFMFPITIMHKSFSYNKELVFGYFSLIAYSFF